MDVDALEVWLKTSVLGIVVLGAIGSAVAVLAAKLVRYIVTDLIPVPYIAHRTKGMRRAFTVGWASAVFDADKKGHTSTVFLAYRLARLLIALFAFLSLLILFSLALALSPEIVVTLGTLITITLSFISLYWAYHEYELIRLIYKSFWRNAEEVAKARKFDSNEDPLEAGRNFGSCRLCGCSGYIPDKPNLCKCGHLKSQHFMAR